MDDGDLPNVDESRQRRAAVVVAVVSVVWLLVGIGVSLGLQGVPFGAAPGTVEPPASAESRVQLALGLVAFAALFVASAYSGERLSGILGS